MKLNETLITYPDSTENSGYHIRVYDSSVDFLHRDFFAHRHADFELSYILSGRGIYRLRDGEASIESGDLFVFGTNQIHCITDTFADEKMLLLNIQFEPRMIWSPLANLLSRDYLSLFSGKCEKLSKKSPAYEFIAKKMLEIRNETSEKKVGFEILVRAYLCEIITALMRDCPISAEDAVRETKTEGLIRMDRTMTYINENLSASLTLEGLAAHCGFSRTYFSSLFTSLNGLTPWEYITIRRIEKSKELLKDTDMSVLSVASACGYDNLSNFNRMFVRTTGFTPSAYRKQFKCGTVRI